jgi:hypothetical protein
VKSLVLLGLTSVTAWGVIYGVALLPINVAMHLFAFAATWGVCDILWTAVFSRFE